METVQVIDEMNDVHMMMWAWGDRTWWVIESIFLHSLDKGFWHVKLFSRVHINRGEWFRWFLRQFSTNSHALFQALFSGHGATTLKILLKNIV